MKRPLADKRPIGPFAQLVPGENAAEVNIYFEKRNIPQRYITGVENVLDDSNSFGGTVSGPFGVKSNVVSFATIGNQTTLSNLDDLEDDVEDELGADIDDIEVIW